MTPLRPETSGGRVVRGRWRAWIERMAPSRFQLTLPRSQGTASPDTFSSGISHRESRPGDRLGDHRVPPGVFSVRIFKVGQCEMPGPAVFRVSPQDDWHLL
jgi:hypothetical protein